MIKNRSHACTIAIQYLNPDPEMNSIGDEYIIVDHDTIETRFGWMFHYDSRIHYEIGNLNEIRGSSAVIVERVTGNVYGVPPIVSRRYQMRVNEYDRTRSLWAGLLAVSYGVIDGLKLGYG